MIILFECLLISPTPCLNSTGWCFTVWTKPINILCWRAILRNIKLYHALLTQKFHSNYSFDSQKVSRDICITHPVILHQLVPPATRDDRATAKPGRRPLPKTKAQQSQYTQSLPSDRICHTTIDAITYLCFQTGIIVLPWSSSRLLMKLLCCLWHYFDIFCYTFTQNN